MVRGSFCCWCYCCVCVVVTCRAWSSDGVHMHARPKCQRKKWRQIRHHWFFPSQKIYKCREPASPPLNRSVIHSIFSSKGIKNGQHAGAAWLCLPSSLVFPPIFPQRVKNGRQAGARLACKQHLNPKCSPICFWNVTSSLTGTEIPRSKVILTA